MKKQKQNQDQFIVIMAGGRGERFWPVSREKTPKQLITLLGKRSFLQQAVDRIMPVVPAKNIIVITNAIQAPLVKRQLKQIPAANIISEPCGRDTCAAVALATALVHARAPHGVFAILPADHVIPDAIPFQQVLSDTLELAAREPVIITIGINPTEPATGYGYIHLGADLKNIQVTHKTQFSKALKFVEKPNLEKAQKYVKSREYRWNAGMFTWSVATVMEGLRQHQPEMAALALKWAEASQKGRLARQLAQDYPSLPKISIDYALMEKATNVVVADGAFAWDDLGAWPALARHIALDDQGNASQATFIGIDATGNIIFDARKKNRTLTALVGIQDCIIVHTDDATLIAHKNQAQKIKELVGQIGKTTAYRKLV